MMYVTCPVCAAGYGMAAHSVIDTSREKTEYYRPPGHLGIRSSPLQLPVQQPQVGAPHTTGHYRHTAAHYPTLLADIAGH